MAGSVHVKSKRNSFHGLDKIGDPLRLFRGYLIDKRLFCRDAPNKIYFITSSATKTIHPQGSSIKPSDCAMSLIPETKVLAIASHVGTCLLIVFIPFPDIRLTCTIQGRLRVSC